MSERKHLTLLAERCGISTAYWGFDGRERVSSIATLEALVDALGFEAGSEDACEAALRTLDAEADRAGLPSTRVVRGGAPELAHAELHVPLAYHGAIRYRVELVHESGSRFAHAGESSSEHLHGRTLRVPMPGLHELGFGYHELRATLELGSGPLQSSQDLIVCPPTCLEVSEVIGLRRAPGLWLHLYSLHSQRSTGIGDLRDLRTLCAWAADLGLEFVGINPLHAVDNTQSDVSPYYPLSRLYRNPIYLDVESVVGRAGAREARKLLTTTEAASERKQLNATARVDYKESWKHKQRVLETAFVAFQQQHLGHDTELGRAYRAYRTREGQRLSDFAVFSTLREQLQAADPRNGDFRSWPAEYRDARSPEVQNFARTHSERVEFHAYLQFELEAQVHECQRAARSAGMPIGLYGDLALGDAPFCAEAWAQPALYARRVQVGAPPDPFSDSGQDWGLLPFNPLALRADRYRAFRALLQHALREKGALRIDHAMGLTRQFWVPSGASAREGGYVRFPLSDLLGILALESRRLRALVIGEDLGVVPDGFRERMAETGLLRSQVLYFEHVPPSAYARGALATVGTHDLPPLLGFWSARDLYERRRAGNIESDDALARALEERELKKRDLLGKLRDAGLLPAGDDEPSANALSAALQVYLASAASRLVAFGLDDLTLELDALNIPAVALADAPNWSRRTRLALDQLTLDPEIRAVVHAAVRRAREV